MPYSTEEKYRAYCERNKLRIKERHKKYYEANKSQIYEVSKKWKEKNVEKMREYHRGYGKNRRKFDISFRISGNLRNRIRKVLKGINKSASTIKLFGCSIEFLKGHIENKFTIKMNWDNYGSYWEVDHVIPCSLFNFNDGEEQKKCFHYSNLQPLTCEENIKKGNKILL